MPAPRHDPVSFPSPRSRQRKVRRLRRMIDDAVRTGRTGMRIDPGLADSILPLIARLEEIDALLDPPSIKRVSLADPALQRLFGPPADSKR